MAGSGRRVPMTAALAVAYLDEAPRRPHVAWAQFCSDWNRADEVGRRALLEAPVGGSRRAVAIMASTAHALLDRDGGEVPAWVAEAQASEDITSIGVPVTSPFGQRIVELSPPTCAQHRVYFDAAVLSRP